MKNKSDWAVGGLFIIIGILVGLGWNLQVVQQTVLQDRATSEFKAIPGLAYSSDIPEYDYIQPIACTSNSMGPIIQCGSQLYISTSFDITPGSIYTFSQGNKTIAHRLIACVDTECTQLLFKGDTNSIPDETVNLSDVIGKVVLIEIP